MSNYVNIDSIEKKKNAVAMLSGDVRQVEALSRQFNGQPLPIAEIQWCDNVYNVNSYELSVVLYDALRYDDYQDLFVSRHIQELLDLHKQLCKQDIDLKYGNLEFIIGHEIEYFDEVDIPILLNDGVSEKDIELTNYGIQRKEDEVVRLLKRGASPYFLNRTNSNPDAENRACSYFDIAPMLSILDEEINYQWSCRGLNALRGNVEELSIDSLERIVYCLFQVAACYRILYLVDKNISPSAKAKGEELMLKYDVYYPILDFKPDEE